MTPPCQLFGAVAIDDCPEDEPRRIQPTLVPRDFLRDAGKGAREVHCDRQRPPALVFHAAWAAYPEPAEGSRR